MAASKTKRTVEDIERELAEIRGESGPLHAEYRNIPKAVEEAVDSGDFEEATTLRRRREELPARLYALAKRRFYLDAEKAELGLFELDNEIRRVGEEAMRLTEQANEYRQKAEKANVEWHGLRDERAAHQRERSQDSRQAAAVVEGGLDAFTARLEGRTGEARPDPAILSQRGLNG